MACIRRKAWLGRCAAVGLAVGSALAMLLPQAAEGSQAQVLDKPTTRRAAQPEEIRFKSSDGVLLRADLWRCPLPRPGLILLVPGFAQHKGTGTMRFIAGLLSPCADVLVLDLRGTGSSDGLYTFGAREYLDVQAALGWAQSSYHDLSVLGFSLGAYIALRASVEGPLRPTRTLLVSLPERFETVISSGGVVSFLRRGMWQQNSDPLAVKEDADTLFRWGAPFMPKPLATALAGRATVPLHFLSGGLDLLVYPSQSLAAYQASPAPATWTLWPTGRHAEHMALKHPEAFVEWVRGCMLFDGKDKQNDPFGAPQ